MLYKFTLLIATLILWSDLSAQQIGHTTVTFVDSSRNNRQIVTELYYPATSAGNNTPIMAGVFPLITFGHGFVMAWSAYQNFWELLVPEGYILAFPKTETGFSPSHADFGKDLKFLITKIQSSGVGTIIPVTSVGTTSAILGHSMGGGSSFLAAENNTGITTMVSFAAANTNPSAITAAQDISVPVLLFSGSNDCVTPPIQHQDIMYDSTISAHKTQLYITGGGHCYFANSNFNCTVGESTCSPSPTITRGAQQSVTNDFLKLWLANFLKGDCQKGLDFQDSLSASTRISFRQSQSIACFTGVPNIPAVTNVTLCGPGAATLTATGGSTYFWYDSASGGSPIDTGAIFTTPYLMQSDTLWVSSFDCCESIRVPGVITVIAFQISENDTAICPGSSVTLSVTESGASATESYTFLWSTGDTNSSITITPSQTTTYVVTVTNDNASCTDSVTVTVKPTLSGSCVYDNLLMTPMSCTKVFLMTLAGGIVDSTFTDTLGKYQFCGMPDGTYKLSARIIKEWGGVNSTDALLATKHFVNQILLTGMKQLAADVNNTGNINATDALIISKRYTGIIGSFTLQDWLLEDKTVTIAGSSLGDVDFKAICAGDANGSYNPPGCAGYEP